MDSQRFVVTSSAYWLVAAFLQRTFLHGNRGTACEAKAGSTAAAAAAAAAAPLGLCSACVSQFCFVFAAGDFCLGHVQ